MLEFADSPAVVGRDREVAAIAGLLDAASGGTPAVLLIGGEAPIGKTALVEQATLLAGERGLRVLQGDCLATSAHIPFRPLSRRYARS